MNYNADIQKYYTQMHHSENQQEIKILPKWEKNLFK
jgi:hypothetical protein